MEDFTTLEIKKQARAARQTKPKLMRLAQELMDKTAAIRERRDIGPEQRDYLEEQVRKETLKKYEQISEDGMDAYRRGEIYAKQIRTARSVDTAARERVKSLLDGGTAPMDIIERAVQHGDAETVAAVRQAMQYWKPDGAKEFADTSEVIVACDRALSQVGLGNEPARAKAMVDLHHATDGIDDVRRFVMDSVAGQGQGASRIRAAYATSDASDAD